MQKSFKLIVSTLICVFFITASDAQEAVKFKEVLLDGKPAKLNLSTGEITLVVSPVPISETKTSVLDVSSKKAKISDSTVASGSSKNLIGDATSDYHIVKPGETLYQLSKRYKVSLSELKKANQLETTLISIGQKLRIRNFDKTVPKPKIWVVEKGDNLYRIALKNGTTVEAIKQKNGLTSNVIKIGQKLRLD